MELVLSSDNSNKNDEEVFQNDGPLWRYDGNLNGMLKQTFTETQTYEDEADFDDISTDLDWYTATENMMLDELSILCRDLHEKLSSYSAFGEFENLLDDEYEETKPLSPYKRSSSSENISSFIDSEEDFSNFDRDCKVRRSLPINNKYLINHAYMKGEDSDGGEKNRDLLDKGKPRLYAKKAYNKWTPGKSRLDSSESSTLLEESEDTSDEKSSKDQPKEDSSILKPNNKTVVQLNNSSSSEADNNRADKEENRSTKKVGFSKTEIHFAPDSGKVNIVETDGKPPPTNKFRRRRRDHMKNMTFPTNNLPVTHFGDTSYEKYIFGGSKNPSARRNVKLEDLLGNRNKEEENGSKKEENRSKKEENLETSTGNETDLNREKKEESKHRGHITTINFMADDVREPKKLVQGTNETTKDSNKNMQSNETEDQKDSLVTRTTKMTVHIPFTIPEIPHLKNIPFSSLKSVKLILNLKPIMDRQEVENLFSSFYESEPRESSVESCRIEEKDTTDGLSLPKSREKQNIYDSIVSKDLKNNVVAAKTVKVHKPTVSRVEKDYVSSTLTKLTKPREYAKIPPTRRRKGGKEEKSPNKSKELIYVNIFGDSHNKVSQIYENIPATKTSQNKSSEKETAGQNKVKMANEKPTLSLLRRSLRSSKIDAKANEKKIKNMKNTETSESKAKNSSSTRSKKPVEIVYKTAVFNMPNETLAKPTKSKEPKSSCYINDLICGKKSKPGTDSKKVRQSLSRKPKNNS